MPTRLENDGKNSPFSMPAMKATHSTSPTTGPPVSAKRVSHCHPYCVVSVVGMLKSVEFLVYLGMRPTPRTLAILLLGLASILLGVTFKLNHLIGAHTLFNAGVVVTVVGVVLWVVQLVRGEAK